MSDYRRNPDAYFPREALVEDVRTLARTLESVHPDPYSGHGGRVSFHRHLEELVRSIPEEGESLGRFYWRVQTFVAGVRDGHTSIEAPEGFDDGIEGRFPLDIRVVGTSLYVEAVYDDAHSDLLGGRLASVAGLSVPKLRARHAAIESADNRYDDLARLTNTLKDGRGSLQHVLGEGVTSLAVTVETQSGEPRERSLDPIEADDPVETLETTVEYPETNGQPAYRFLDDGATALLALPDCHSHREVHEIAASIGGGMGDHYDTRETYRQLVGEPVPEDPDEALAGLPSATDILTDLVEEMADAGTETLVIDTRDNGGGSSLLAYLLLYVLHGQDGIVEAGGDQFSVPKDSALYREQYGENGPIDETPNPAGFDFDSYFEGPETSATETMEDLSEHSPTFAAEVESGEFAGYYRPERIVVVTSASTYSAGIEPGILLSKLGATVVGVPSGQAANGPRDLLFDDLPNTGLEFKLSYRHHEFLPGEDGTVFEPDVELTPSRFEAFDRAGDAGVRLALSFANDEVPPED